MHRLLAADRSLAAIAAEHSMSRNTVRRFARSADHGEPLAHNWTSCRASISHDYERTCGTVELRLHQRGRAVAGDTKLLRPHNYVDVRQALSALPVRDREAAMSTGYSGDKGVMQKRPQRSMLAHG